MKNIKSFSLKYFPILLLLFISVYSFNDKPQRTRSIVNVEKIRVLEAADLSSIAETTADILVVCDRATTIPAGTLPFPQNPIDGQLMMVSSRVQITALTLDAGAIPISGAITTLAAGGAAAWVYDLVSNRWFRHP